MMADGTSSLPFQQAIGGAVHITKDWQSGKTLSESLEYAHTSGEASDVTFIVGDDKIKISAHKMILAIRSPVFFAMLEGHLPEKGEITIPDIRGDIFKSFLRYLYTDTIDLTIENVVPVFSAARKYMVDKLSKICEDFIYQNLSVENVCLFLEDAHVFQNEKLSVECLQLIVSSGTACLRSAAFTDLCATCMATVAKADDLDAEESDVYLAITNWAEAECCRQNIEATRENKKEVLGDMIYLARYNKMDLDFILDRVFLDNILNSDLAVGVVNYRKHPHIIKESPLTNQSRSPQEKTKVWRCCDFSLKHFSSSFCTEEAVTFQVFCTAAFHGIGSLITGERQSTSDVEVFEEENLIKTEKGLPLVRTEEKVGEIVFEKPIILKAGTTYTVNERASSEKSYKFGRLINQVPFHGGMITFKIERRENMSSSVPYLILTKLDSDGH